MKIKLTSVFVDDQERALRFYTEKLGFVKKHDIAQGEYRWLTVVSPEEPEGVELVLEPMGFEPAKAYQQALREAGIPATMFFVDDIAREYERLRDLGVGFTEPPAKTTGATTATLDDTCGNLIRVAQLSRPG